MTTKKVHALAAIDVNGKWIVYGFDGLQTVNDLHETAVTDDLVEPMAFFRLTAELIIPEQLSVREVQAKVEKVD